MHIVNCHAPIIQILVITKTIWSHLMPKILLYDILLFHLSRESKEMFVKVFKNIL